MGKSFFTEERVRHEGGYIITEYAKIQRVTLPEVVSFTTLLAATEMSEANVVGSTVVTTYEDFTTATYTYHHTSPEEARIFAAREVARQLEGFGVRVEGKP